MGFDVDRARTPGINRREFLWGSGATVVLALTQLRCREAELVESVSPPAFDPPPAYGDWRDLYRERWTWDSISKSTHYVNCAYQRGCAWNIYVKDGIVWREEQVADYPQTNSGRPRLQSARLPEGGLLQRPHVRRDSHAAISAQARRARAARTAGSAFRLGRGPARGRRFASIDAILIETGPARSSGTWAAPSPTAAMGLGLTRTVSVLDTPMLETNTEIGDHYPGATVDHREDLLYTGSFDDLFYSDLILIWGGNPNYTQIPNVHFINEARYHGARGRHHHAGLQRLERSTRMSGFPVGISGTDAAFGLSLAQVMVEEGSTTRASSPSRPTCPSSCATDTGLFLRARATSEEGGAEDDVLLCIRPEGASGSDPEASDQDEPVARGTRPGTGGGVPGSRRSIRRGDGHAGLLAAARAPGRLHARRPHPRPLGTPPGADGAPAGARDRPREGGDGHHPDQLREVLPRARDGAGPDPGLRAGGTDRKEGRGIGMPSRTSLIAGPEMPGSSADGRLPPKLGLARVLGLEAARRCWPG